jgi:hypothetical protein
MRASILEADVEIDPAHVQVAMQQALADGLDAKLPDGAIGKLGAELAPVAPSTEVSSVATAGASTASVDSGAYAELARQVLALQPTDAPPMHAQMLQTLLLSQIAQADQPRGAATMTTPPKGVVAKENMGDGDEGGEEASRQDRRGKLWAECMAVGRKLEGMITHACSIISQAAHESNDWYRARNEPEPLRNVLAEVETTSDEWSSRICSSKIGNMAQKLGSIAKCVEWLTGHRADLETQSTKLQRQLGELVGMHNARLRTREVSVKLEKSDARKRIPRKR